MKTIHVIKSFSSKKFEDGCERYLARGYEISSTSCNVTETYPSIVTYYQAIMVRSSEIQKKVNSDKIDLVKSILRTVGLSINPGELTDIGSFDYRVIKLAGESFFRSIIRDPERKNLNYFFGILSSIQRNSDKSKGALKISKGQVSYP